MSNQYKQIGNAVPVKLALAVAEQIKLFLKEPEDDDIADSMTQLKI